MSDAAVNIATGFAIGVIGAVLLYTLVLMACLRAFLLSLVHHLIANGFGRWELRTLLDAVPHGRSPERLDAAIERWIGEHRRVHQKKKKDFPS